jgi:hypothetical protein
MDIHLRFFFLLLLAPALLALPAGGPHLFLSFQALKQLDAISASRIESPEDAVAYVRNAAAQFGIAGPALLPNGVESSLAAAELEVAKDPSKLVSDDRVAQAFNFLSDELRVANPRRLTGADILLYRGVKASMFPHLYSPKTVSGSRPLGALIMLDTLICEGGVMDGIRKAALLDRPPGSLKVTDGRIVGHPGAWTSNGNPNLINREYRNASLAYFAQLSPREIRSFFDRLAGILAL